MQLHSHKALEIASFVSFLAALALSIPVFERLAAALWVRFKFAGEGHIYLSHATGVVFSAILAVAFGLAFGLNRLAVQKSINRAMHWSRLAMLVTALAVACYWLLGTSTLNVWRA